MLKQRKAKNIRQKLSHDSDTEQDTNAKDENNDEQDIFVKRTKGTWTFGRKWYTKKAGVGLGSGDVTKANRETNASLLVKKQNQEPEEEWFPQECKQLGANVSSLVEQVLTENQVKQPKPEYSLETMEELKRNTFGWNKEETEQNGKESPERETVNSNKETFPESCGEGKSEEEMEINNEEVDSESETRWELEQLRRASGNNKYTRKLEKLSNKKLESFHIPELLQEPPVVLEKVTKGLEDAMKTNEEEISKVLQEQLEREKVLDNCQRQLKDKETQVMEASEKYSFYEELGQYFDNLLDMLNEKWTQLDSLRTWEDNLYEEYEKNETFQGISLLQHYQLVQLPKNEEELYNQSIPVDSSQVNESFANACQSRLQEKLASIQESRNALFQDVEWDYSSVSQVVAHFVWWRKNYPKDYEEAYGELMLSKLITEYTKIELLGCWPFGLQSLWNVQSIQALDFYHQEFGETLCRSSCLISILDEAIVPIVSKWIRHLYSYQDPHETKAMSIFCKEILDLSKDSDSMASIHEKMNVAFLEKAKDILSQFTDLSCSWKNEQQWNAFVYILRMISFWHALIPFKKPVEQFILDEIITRHMLPKVRTLSNEDIVDQLYFILCRCLPQEWPDPCSPYWLAIRALLSRLVIGMKETDKLKQLEACKKRCGYD